MKNGKASAKISNRYPTEIEPRIGAAIRHKSPVDTRGLHGHSVVTGDPSLRLLRRSSDGERIPISLRLEIGQNNTRSVKLVTTKRSMFLRFPLGMRCASLGRSGLSSVTVLR
jgi:hypothetical protein